jgi:hypothetical protein
MPSGFDSTALTPIADVNAFPMLSLYILKSIIRMFGLVLFKIDATSAPFIRGIDRSSKTKSGFSVFACSMASKPSTASPQISISARPFKNSRMTIRILALSSASPAEVLRRVRGIWGAFRYTRERPARASVFVVIQPLVREPFVRKIRCAANRSKATMRAIPIIASLSEMIGIRVPLWQIRIEDRIVYPTPAAAAFGLAVFSPSRLASGSPASAAAFSRTLLISAPMRTEAPAK